MLIHVGKIKMRYVTIAILICDYKRYIYIYIYSIQFNCYLIL